MAHVYSIPLREVPVHVLCLNSHWVGCLLTVAVNTSPFLTIYMANAFFCCVTYLFQFLFMSFDDGIFCFNVVVFVRILFFICTHGVLRKEGFLAHIHEDIILHSKYRSLRVR